MKKVIRLNEGQFREFVGKLLRESVNNIMEERSLSHGTMRPYDVSNALLSFLKDEHPEVYSEFIEKHPNMAGALSDENAPYWDSDEASYDYNEDLVDTMDSVAPEGEYFGSHPGDGSDYGFWKSENEDELNEAINRAFNKVIKK